VPTFVYVTVSTLVVFSVFGYVLGRQADALVDLSRTDALTGLGNHRAFTERVAQEVSRAARYRLPLSLLLVDVDRLKAINDRGGHAGGDAALRLVADALRADARESDLARAWEATSSRSSRPARDGTRRSRSPSESAAW
jgi:diguanylate cyclase with GGDEF domain